MALMETRWRGLVGEAVEAEVESVQIGRWW